MFERLDEARSLTANQIKIIAAAIIGDMLEFFDYFLIGFVLAFIIKPWGLTFGQSAIVLKLSTNQRSEDCSCVKAAAAIMRPPKERPPVK